MSGQGYQQYSSTSERRIPQYANPASTPGQPYQEYSTDSDRQYLNDSRGIPQDQLRCDIPRSHAAPYSVNAPVAGFPPRTSQRQGYQYPASYSANPTPYSDPRGVPPSRRSTQPTRSNTGTSSSSDVQSRWTFDTVEAYDLDREDLKVWLTQQFGDANFSIQLMQDDYVFYVPRKLSTGEKRDIAKKRRRNPRR